MLGHGRAELLGRQWEVEEALNSSSILPNHRAMLGTAFTHFWSTEAGILDIFLNLAKGSEVNML